MSRDAPNVDADFFGYPAHEDVSLCPSQRVMH